MAFKICLEDYEQSEEDILVSNHEVELVEPYVEDAKRAKAIEKAFDAMHMLEETVSVVRQNPEGMSEAGLRMIDKNISLARDATGMNKTDTIYPSVENLKSFSARKLNTKIALEGLKDSIMRIFYAIKSAIKSVIDWFLGFFRSSDRMYKSSLSKIKHLKSELKSNKDKLEDFANGKFQNAVAISKLKINQKGDFPKGMSNLENFIDMLIKTLRDYTTNTMMASIQVVEKVVFEKAQPRTDIFSEMSLPAIFQDKQVPGHLTPKNMQSFSTNDLLPGSQLPAIFVYNPASNSNIVYREYLNILAQSKFFFASDMESFTNPQEVEYLSRDQLLLFLSTMENICEKLILNSEPFKKVLDSKSKLDKLITMYLDKESKKPKEDKETIEVNKPSGEFDQYGFRDSDSDMFRFSMMIRSLNSYLDNVPVKMITNTTKLTQEALYYGLAYAVDNLNALKRK